MERREREQPLHHLKWVERGELSANQYNPNHVADIELDLLKLSILQDGWTQPIVALTNGEIVDGYHRWLVSKDPEIKQMTNGLVPVVYIDADKDHQMCATIRHNRARGTHAVLKMADIVRCLIDEHGVPKEKVQTQLGMEREEVNRLYDVGGMPSRGSKHAFNRGWVPSDDT